MEGKRGGRWALCGGELGLVGEDARSALEKLTGKDEFLPLAGKNLDEADDLDGERLALCPKGPFVRFRFLVLPAFHIVSSLLFSSEPTAFSAPP